METVKLILKFLALVLGIVVAFVHPYISGTSTVSDPLMHRAPVITLIIFISVDAINAFKRKAFWIPARFLVLNALTIQLVSTVNDRSSMSKACDIYQSKDQLMACLLENQIMIDSGRVVLLVYIAYLLPGLVRSHQGFSKTWSDIGALILNVLYSSSKNISISESQKPKRVWFIISNTTIFASIILLLLLLSCAVLAGKSIYNILSQKIPLALSCCSVSAEEWDYEKIKEHVLKCWIVARACHPDYIIARSVLSSLAGLVVTVCVLIFCGKFIHFHRLYFDKLSLGKQTMVATEFVFVLLGWFIVLFRWIRAVIHFPRNHEVVRLFHVEDFWTRSLVDNRDDVLVQSTHRWFSLKKGQDVKLEKKFRSNKGSDDQGRRRRRNKGSGDQGRRGRRNNGSGGQGNKRKQNRKKTPLKGLDLPTWLTIHVRLWLQKILVLLSKAFWFLSEMVYKVSCCCLDNSIEIKLSSVEGSPGGQFPMYRDTLDCIRMTGERAASLWIDNEKAFQEIMKRVEIAKGIGKNKCKELTLLIGKNRGPVEDEAVALLAEENTLLEEENSFPYMGKKSWKRRAVSLIYFIIYFYDGANSHVVDDAFQAYSQAWDLLDFVDKSDPEAKIVSDSADKDFNILINIWENLRKRKSQSPDKLSQQIKQQINPFMDKLSHKDLHDSRDSRDWMTAASKISLFKRWKTIDQDSSQPAKSSNSAKMDDNVEMLATVIAHCIEKELPKALIENCNKWALDRKEAAIYKAAFIAGKASGLLSQNGEGDDAVSGPAAVETKGEGNDTIIEVPTE